MSAIDEQEGSPREDDTPDLVQDAGSNEEDDADLFGDDDDEDVVQSKERPNRRLEDEELDSGDDEGRNDRVAKTVEVYDDSQDRGRPLRIAQCDLPRINYPEGDEFYLLNVPNFLGIRQECFDPENFEPPNLPHDGDPNRQTSSYSTAMSSMFWRHDPQTSEMQSTARFIRWSDGSLTLQLATKPMEQYKVSALELRQNFNKKMPPGTHYDPAKDSLTFLAAAHSSPVIDLQLVRALDATMKIHPSGGATDESEVRLRQMLQATKEDHDPLARMKELKEDPDLARKAAEQFEKDRLRAQRKRENAEERQTMKRTSALGRVGMGGGRTGAGLASAAALEDEMGMPMTRGKKKPKRKTNNRGEIYSDNEDETMPRSRTKEDEYDMEDDFLADSDEEPEQYGDDDDLLDDEEEDPDRDDLEIEGRRTVLEDRSRRERTPKRSRMEDIDDDDDAEGEPDDELLRQSPQQVRKRRRVIDDEEEDEE